MATRTISLIDVTLCVLKALDQTEKIKDMQGIKLDRPIVDEPFWSLEFSCALESTLETIGVNIDIKEVIIPGTNQTLGSLIETVFTKLEEQT